MKLFIRCLVIALALCLSPVVTTIVFAQEEATDGDEKKDGTKPTEDGEAKPEDKTPAIQHKVTVTATRTKEDTFNVPQPVAVVTLEEIAEKNPNTSSDLLRELPGVDVSGVGTSQARPFIRGQRGQRVLLLEDGIRLNNPRRDSDFGELPAIVDISSAEQIEIVRGPASVLYGSDAIGGVVNTIALRPTSDQAVAGSIGLRYSTADSQSKGMVNLNGTVGKVNYLFNGIYRTSSAYDAPAGDFGEITLADKTLVNDTGVDDDTLIGRVGYILGDGQEIFARYERYRADFTGFGWVDPSEYDYFAPISQIAYPYQNVDKFSVGYRGTDLDTPFANSIEGTLYWRKNEREFIQDIRFETSFFDAQLFKGQDFSEVETFGLRFEANKLFGNRNVMTYGLDWFEDHTEGTNQSLLYEYDNPFLPPTIIVDETPRIPTATYGSWGLFIQDQWKAAPSLTLIGGLRHQETTSDTEPTPGLPSEVTDDSVKDTATVGAINVLWALGPELNVTGSLGTAFRSPNLAERFFLGPDPTFTSLIIRNPSIKPEQSVNVDLGFKYRRRSVGLELTFFRNDVDDGIRLEFTGETDPVTDLPIVQYVNVDKLAYAGAELGFTWAFWRGFSTSLNYTYLTGENRETNRYSNESYPQKLNFVLRYASRGGRWWAEYHVRRNGEQDNIIWDDEDGDGLPDPPPVGPVLPSFSVNALRGGVTLFRNESMTHQVGLSIENLTDELYTETNNASFFRPEPGRNYIVSYRLDF